MLDVASILNDPELGSTTFTVERTVYKRAAGEVTALARSTFPVTGCVHPGSPEQLQQLPEEDRHEEYIVVYCPPVLSLGENHEITYTRPDRILWGGKTWRLVRLKPWTAFGFVQGVAVLVQSESDTG